MAWHRTAQSALPAPRLFAATYFELPILSSHSHSRSQAYKTFSHNASPQLDVAHSHTRTHTHTLVEVKFNMPLKPLRLTIRELYAQLGVRFPLFFTL